MERKHYVCPYDDYIKCDVLDWSVCDRCLYHFDGQLDDSVACPGMFADDDDERPE